MALSAESDLFLRNLIHTLNMTTSVFGKNKNLFEAQILIVLKQQTLLFVAFWQKFKPQSQTAKIKLR